MKLISNSQSKSKSSGKMPDIANTTHKNPQGVLDWVGMSNIHIPILLNAKEEQNRTLATVQAFVNLNDPTAKGIHMSRLYILLEETMTKNTFSQKTLSTLLKGFLSSHQDISTQSFVEFKFDYLTKRSALLSDYSGWKSYPVSVKATLKNNDIYYEISCEIPYSSTCPCSAALARQLIQQQFEQDFPDRENLSTDEVFQWLGTEEGVCATPHSQRSIAQVRVLLCDQCNELPFDGLILSIEDSLKTPVQTAVKREDEQAFAKLNGENLMFCEDAARRIQKTLNADNSIKDFWVRVNHLESLHAHDAVSVVTKGLEDGFTSNPYGF